MGTKKEEQIRADYGANIRDSIGVNAPAPAKMAPPPLPTKLQGVERSKDMAMIEVDRIEPDPDQPRKEFDPEELELLAVTLRADGQQQPIRVRWAPEKDRYVIIMGERRWRAAKIAGLASLACVVDSKERSRAELHKLQMIENLARQDLRPIEQANSFRQLMDEFGWSGKQLARELGIGQPSVVKALALLKLAPELQEKVASGEIAAETGYHMSRVSDPEAQKEIAEQVASGKLSQTEAAKEVRKKAPAAKGRGGKAASKKPKVRTDVYHNDSGYKFHAVNRKGVDPSTLKPALRRWLESLPDGPESAAS